MIKDQLDTDLKETMRARDKRKLQALRLISAAIKQIEIDERIIVSDERALILLDKLAKQRKESIAQFEAAHRDDLVEQEQFELELIQQYLPPPITDSELNILIDQALEKTKAKQVRDMGAVMTYLRPLIQGRTDMAHVSSIVKSRLS